MCLSVIILDTTLLSESKRPSLEQLSEMRNWGSIGATLGIALVVKKPSSWSNSRRAGLELVRTFPQA